MALNVGYPTRTNSICGVEEVIIYCKLYWPNFSLRASTQFIILEVLLCFISNRLEVSTTPLFLKVSKTLEISPKKDQSSSILVILTTVVGNLKKHYITTDFIWSLSKKETKLAKDARMVALARTITVLEILSKPKNTIINSGILPRKLETRLKKVELVKILVMFTTVWLIFSGR